MQMVASGYGVTLAPKVALDVEVRNERIRLSRFVEPQPKSSMAWPDGSPRRARRIFMRSAAGALDIERKLGRASRARQDTSRGLVLTAGAPDRGPYSAATAAPRSSIFRPRRLATPAPY
jgi:hypothetical protein